MKPPGALRGAAIPETALVLTATLALVFGIVQIGLIGFLQIMVDGAAFIAAHEYALGNTATYIATTQRPFPQLALPIVIDTNAPSATDVPVNYNTTNATARHGGVSLVRGSHLQATVTNPPPGGLFGSTFSNASIHGSAIEPDNMVSNAKYDLNGQGYSGVATQTDFYANTQNSGANYISLEEMATCNTAHFDAFCPAGNVAVRALGTAEFLDHDNWARPNLGVGPYASNYTFAEMLCHEQKYAQAAATIFTPGALPSTTNLSETGSGVIGQIYSWDYVSTSGGGYTGQETYYGKYPLSPSNFC